jgi:hypothetical protein
VLLTLKGIQHLINLEKLDIEILQIIKDSTGLSFKLIQRVDEFNLLADLSIAALFHAETLAKLFDLSLNNLIITGKSFLLSLLLLELGLDYLLLS